MGLLLALVMCLSMAACGKKVSIEDLEGFWYPPEGIGTTMSVLTCIYIDGTAGTWEEYDQYGDPTGNTGNAYTDGTVLTLTDVPLIGEVEIPIGDADTLLTDTGEAYWIKGEPDFISSFIADTRLLSCAISSEISLNSPSFNHLPYYGIIVFSDTVFEFFNLGIDRFKPVFCTFVVGYQLFNSGYPTVELRYLV